jgi:diguanylate cyclase (GGDEF)-like protein
MPGWTTARVTTILLPLLAAAAMVFAVIGLTFTQREDGRGEVERYAALQNALDDLHAGDADRFEPEKLRLIERSSGLADLRFDSDLLPDSRREVQSLHDPQGRIIGWFSWAPDRALARAMYWLWGMAGAVAGMLALCAFLALRSTRRLDASLARSIQSIRKLTTQDLLTGLPNRSVTLERLDEAMAMRGSKLVIFALIDIDSFQDINDTLGRAGGDTMLKAIAAQLQSAVPAGAQFGRFEEDTFSVIATSENPAFATELGDKLTAALFKPVFMDQEWQVTVEIGVALAPEDGTTDEELTRRAALALRAAKQSGRGAVRRYVPKIHEEHAERRFFLRELEIAIEQNSLDVHYQPVVAADGGGMVGVEALSRWTHPTRGTIAPSMFIPLAEESGLMNRLGESVLRRALTDGARWPDLFVSVNLSPVQVKSRGLVDLVAATLRATGMTASRLILEVTEGVLIDNPEETLAKLEALRGLGAATALDDFGSGYSSLNYLQKFPFDLLKIDRAFVASLGTSGNTGAIIQSIVTLGHALGMKVLAEGVETNEQRVLLRLAGCDEMQGYLFAKACPAEGIDKILARPSARAAKRGGAAS